ncbi:MAG TPA: rhomboid family intramembrane serine protease [Gemmatimonadaceae bacterium]
MTPWVKRLLAANILVFFLQSTMPGVTNLLVYVPADILVRPWTVITYMFAHASMSHIFFNMLTLYFFGPRVEERLGSKRFIILYGISGIVGAALSTVLAPNAAILGASGAVLGVMFAFAKFWPTAQIYIMGILPIEARLALILFTLYTIWSGFHGSQTGVADFAHLGGLAGAWAYLAWLDRRAGTKSFRKQTVAPVGRDVLGNWKKVNLQSIHEVNRDAVNAILDKISAKGLASLTPEERLFLSNFVPPDDRVPPVS